MFKLQLTKDEAYLVSTFMIKNLKISPLGDDDKLLRKMTNLASEIVNRG